ncbi:hypothetical protein ACOSQ4_030561 [Xanthoceras sorbifolium]
MAQQFPSSDNNLESKTNQQIIRPLADFPSNVWKDNDTFTSNIAARILEFNQTCGRHIEELKDKVEEMLMAPINDPVEKVNLINSLSRLGVSYYFRAEIEEHLTHIFEAQPSLLNDNDYDLYTTALLFRVLRQHGYKVSSSTFNKFKDNNGEFKENLTNDAKGMLSLYEATHLRHHGEDILEKALVFSKAHLKSLAEKSSPHLAKQIINALEIPLHKGMPRLEALKYISFYQEDESRNETLLLFAKLDFNRVQLLHQQELCHLSSWWKDLNLPSKLPYIRDRVMESFLWISIIYSEPCYSYARSILFKINNLMTVIDDTYDSYGTLEELRLFNDAVQRWDISALEDLPDYMKIIYSALLNIFDEIYNDMTEEERSYKFSYTKDTMKEMVKAYLAEAEWFYQNYVPPFDEYLRYSLISIGSFSYTAAKFLGMEKEIAGTHAFEWLQSRPKILTAAYVIARLKNDLIGHKSEFKRVHIACGVECYMKEYGLSMKETAEKFDVIFENAWKDMNEECMKPTTIPMEILLRVANIGRLMEVTYKDMDGYTNPQYLRDDITKLFIDQIPI